MALGVGELGVELELHWLARRGRGTGAAAVGEGLEVWSDVAPRDLGRRPPERVPGCLALASATRDPRAHPVTSETGEENSAEHRPERLRLHVRAGQAGDRSRGRVRLLGGEAALLDRKGDGVAAGPDAIGTGDAAVGVDLDEATTVRGETGQLGRDGSRQRDDAPGLQWPRPGLDDEGRRVAVLLDVCAGLHG